MKFKKFSALMVAAALMAGSLTATAFADDRPAPAESGSKEIDTLALQFVPSRDPEEIISGTSDLPELLIAAMADRGYTIGNVEITVSDSYEAAGEALAAGAIDVAWLPGGTYALYSDETDVVLTATRNGLSNDSETPADWNGEANATKKDGPQVTFYRALIYATPSEYGKELAAKAQWAVMNVSSSAGYIYPTLWLMDKYDGKMITDLSNVTTLDGYASAFNQAASEAVDVIVCYADGRNDYEESWSIPADETDSTGKQGLGREDVIWNELNVIGVTDKIYNDTVAITMADPDVYNSEFIKDFQDAIIEIAGTEEGKAIFGIYSHTGYATAVDADYDVARAALTVVEN